MNWSVIQLEGWSAGSSMRLILYEPRISDVQLVISLIAKKEEPLFGPLCRCRKERRGYRRQAVSVWPTQNIHTVASLPSLPLSSHSTSRIYLTANLETKWHGLLMIDHVPDRTCRGGVAGSLNSPPLKSCPHDTGTPRN